MNNDKLKSFPIVFTDKNGKWESAEIYWYGTSPRYSVTELTKEEYDRLLNAKIIEKDSDEEDYEEKYAVQISSENATGYISGTTELEFNPTTTKIINGNGDNGFYEAQIQVEKNISGSEDTVIDKDAEFIFKITVYKDEQSGKSRDKNNILYDIPAKAVKAGQVLNSGVIKWEHGAPTPYYVVEELGPDGNPLEEGETIKSSSKVIYTFKGFGDSKYPSEGELKENEDDKDARKEAGVSDVISLSIKATNEIKDRTTTFQVQKSVIFNKIYESKANQSFSVEMKLYGTYKINGATINTEKGDSPWTETTSLSNGQTYTSPSITFWGDNPPTVVVTERKPEYWGTPKYSNNGDTGLVLQEDSAYNKVVITNSIGHKIDLTIDLAGVVWEEFIAKEKNVPTSTPDGINKNEKGVEGVEVYIYENGTKMSTIPGNSYDPEIKLPIITGPDGTWKAGGLKALPNCGKYSVEFVYDGQTYEPTKAFEPGGSAGAYIGSTPGGRNAYKDSSLAIEIADERDEVNNRIQEIYGKSAITGSGFTMGEINGSNGKVGVTYQTEIDEEMEGEKVLSSKLQTVDTNGVAFDVFKAKASTENAGLRFPVDDCYQLDYVTSKLRHRRSNSRI